MSRPADKTASSASAKHCIPEGKPMSASERQLAVVARKRKTHKEVKVFVKNPLKDVMIAVCVEKGLTQAEFIEKLLGLESLPNAVF
ncbi:replication regulatory protein RepA [Klebsiella pneumoniae]